jgi:predicted dehydrogenase
MSKREMTRREMMGKVAGASAAFSIVPARVLGKNPPSGKLNLAFIGVGGRGAKNMGSLKDENYVALCDVDDTRAAESYQSYPKAKQYKDFRVMLDEMDNEIDAVVVSTPDHTHAVAAMHAIMRGKHVYCEKPLAHSVHEVRSLTEAARAEGVQTQMGNQGHSSEHIRLMCEWISAGVIGDIREVYSWSNRLPGKRYTLESLRPEETEPIPDGLDWDLWLSAAAERPYHSCYLPGKWRSWIDFGTGAIGDMGCHILDPSFWALKLYEAKTFEVEATTTAKAPETLRHTFPVASTIAFRFPARGDMPPATLTWDDGGRMPDHPRDLETDRELATNGAILVGETSSIMHGSHGARAMRVIPEVKMQEYAGNLPDKTLPRVEEGHHMDWVRACKEGTPSSGSFDYGGPLAEMVLLGTLAVRCQGRKLAWDAEKMMVVNDEEANAMINPPYREGWSM